jgi:uncharacterized protein (DUF2236 family)
MVHRLYRAYHMAPSPTTVRIAGDARLMAGAGYALLLQVAHPVVSAGVAEHSNFQEDPYGRLVRTLDYVNVSVFGGDEAAAEMGRRTREMHKRIKGVMPDGTRYHSLEPGPFAWVHATLVHSILKVSERFGSRPTQREKETVYADWRAIGEHIGVRPRDLPETYPEFLAYVREMEHTLQATESVRTVLRTMAAPRPPTRRLGDGTWRVARWPAARVLRLTTIGLLGPVVRDRLDLPWTQADRFQFEAMAAANRAAGPLLPRAALEFGPAWLRYRRDALEHQGLALAA